MIREAISAATAGASLSIDDAIEVMREIMEGKRPRRNWELT